MALRIGELMTAARRDNKGSVRHRTTYRAARRNIAKISYRQIKRTKPPKST